MKITVISMRQPWASFIIYGGKWCENRTWKTDHRGELWIHASSWDTGVTREDLGFPMPTGVILGRVNLLGVHSIDDVDPAFDDIAPADLDCRRDLQRLSQVARNFYGWGYVEGPECWLLDERVPLVTPIPMKGKLRLWTADVDAEQLAVVEGFKGAVAGVTDGPPSL